MSRRRLLFTAIFMLVALGITNFLLRGRSLASVLENHPPTAVGDSYTRHGNGAIGPLLANDSDPDGNAMWASIVTNPTNGTLSGGNNSFNFTRNSPTWSGTDSFTYKACDISNACSNVVTVSVTITNQTPVAGNDFYNVHNNTGIGSFLLNDSDPDGDPLTVGDATHPAYVTLPAHGTASGAGNMPLYSPAYGYIGPDTFSYNLCDNQGGCSVGTVNISVNNNAPVAYADFYVVHQMTTIGPFIANDIDPEGDTKSFAAIVSGPSHGTVGGNTWYSPNAGYSGTDSLIYKDCDNLGQCSIASVFILVLPGAAAPPKPPSDCVCPEDPARGGTFTPALGGSQVSAHGSGPAAPDPVNLASGRESFRPAPDLTIYNSSGPSVVWGLNYSGDQALAEVTGYGSPGLTRGWTHNYDIRLQGTIGSWTLKLVYPNGAIETLTPQFNGSVPTGSFTLPAGVPYTVSGVPGAGATWQSVSVTWKDQTKWKFTQLAGTTSYPINQITNRTGQSLNFNWNSNRALTQVSDATSGNVLLTLAYNTSGRLSTTTDLYGRQVVYTFTAGDANNLPVLQSVSQVVSSGTPNPPARWTYGYAVDGGFQLNTITVPNPTGSGNSSATINYNSIGKVSSLVDANGNQRVYTYNPTTTVVQVKDSANNVALSWTQKFDTSGRNTGITDAANHSTTIAYADAANPSKPTTITDRNNHVTSYTYDSFGNVLTATNPRNLTTTNTWSYANFALGRLMSIQEGGKPATTITYYEPSGLVQTITRPEPNNGPGTTTSTFTYDSLGNVLTVVAPGNNATSAITTTLNYTTDGAYSQSAKIGLPLTVTDNLSHVTHLRYDSQGRTTSVTDALGNQTNFTYNLIGQLLTTTFPATGQTGSGNSSNTNAYLYVGGPLTSTTFYDESNTQVRQVSRTYGLEGEALVLTGSTEPVTNTYDALYRLKTLKDGNNNTTTYAYNSIGKLSGITMPGSEVTQFPFYDNDGNLLQRVDGNNVTTNYVYNDPESLLTDIQYPATTQVVRFFVESCGSPGSSVYAALVCCTNPFCKA